MQPVQSRGNSENPRARSLANLRMFEKGKSGNPGGRSKRLEEIRSLAKQHSRRAFNRILELIESDDERVAMAAAKEVLDRAYGKPTVDDTDGDKRQVTINIVRYTDATEGDPERKAESPAVQVRSFGGQALLGVGSS